MKTKRLIWCALALLATGTLRVEATDVVIYTRWQFVKDRVTGEVAAKGAYHHESTEQGAEEIRRYFTANNLVCRVTDDPKIFLTDEFRQARCVVFACTNHEQFETDAERAAFYAWVEAGGGVVALHSASANERTDPKWRAFLGGSFERHYAKRQPVPFRHADRTHPALACLPADYIWADDEIYLNHPMDDVRPLLILDWADVLKESRDTDKYGCPKIGGHVLEWCKTYGKGRIFYSALGHNGSDFGKMEFQLHLLKAAQWAMGDLPDSVAEMSGCAVRTTIEGVECVRDGRTVWRFNLANRESKPFIHPLTLPDGRCVTDARPDDHPWHLGLWFTLKYVNGVNYWEPHGDARGNLFPAGMTVLRDFEIRPQGAACEVALRLWYGPRAEPGRILLDEERTVSFSAPDARGGYRIVSKHVFTAREEVKLDGRRPVSYGGYSCRMAPFVSGFIASGEGGTPDPKRNVAGPKEMTGVTYTDPANGHGITVRVLNPNPDCRVYTWSDHRFANPCFMYAEPVTLKPGERLELAYETVIF